ncbi:Exosome complex exonuclease RRP46 [Entamoeba marina]
MNTRITERQPNEIRPTTIKLGAIKGSNGSCLYQRKYTKVIASIMKEPVEEEQPTEFKINVTFARFSLLNQNQISVIERKQQEVSNILEQTLKGRLSDQNSDFSIHLNVVVIEEDGGVIEAIITAASLALFDGNIAMDDIVIASSVVKYPGIDRPIVDPTAEEEEKKDGAVLIACVPSSNLITQVFMTGVLEPQDISLCLAVAMDSCWAINAEVKKVIEERNNKVNV